MGKHLLIDVGSKMPNLALMQISSYLKSRGEKVMFREVSDYPSDVWVSCPFTWRASEARGLATMWPNAKAHIGGTGISNVRLPSEIEACPPDYSLYNDDRAIGFCQRGCNRRCEFCIVPLTWGRLEDNPYKPLRSWVPDSFKKVLLHDDNLAMSRHHDEILNDVKDLGVKLSLDQGYDLRLLTEQRANLLGEVKLWDLDFKHKRVYVAWDYIGIEPYVRKGIAYLKQAGYNGRDDIVCYMIVGHKTTRTEDLYRFNILAHELNVLPFIMRYNNRKDIPWINHFARYVNRGAYRWIPFEKYRDGVLMISPDTG